MKTRVLSIGGAICLLGLLAVPIQSQAITLTFGDAYYVGHIVNGIPSDLTYEVGYINYLIGLTAGVTPQQIPAGTGEFYDRLNSTLNVSFPQALLPGSAKEDPTDGTVSATGYSYVLGKYDADHAGAYVWYVYNLGGEVTLPDTAVDGKYGLSHVSVFQTQSDVPQTPDGGMTLLLLGSALTGIAAIRRKLA